MAKELLESGIINPGMIVPIGNPVLDGFESGFHIGRILAPPCGGNKLEMRVNTEHGIGENLETYNEYIEHPEEHQKKKKSKKSKKSEAVAA